MKISDCKGKSKSGNLIYEYQERFLVKMPLSTNDTLTVKDKADNKAYSFLGTKDILTALDEIKNGKAECSLLPDDDLDLFEY